jgi:hypothetical protein
MNTNRIKFIGVSAVSHLVYKLLTDPDTFNRWKDLYAQGMETGHDMLQIELQLMEEQRRDIYAIPEIEVVLRKNNIRP